MLVCRRGQGLAGAGSAVLTASSALLCQTYELPSEALTVKWVLLCPLASSSHAHHTYHFCCGWGFIGSAAELQHCQGSIGPLQTAIALP